MIDEVSVENENLEECLINYIHLSLSLLSPAYLCLSSSSIIEKVTIWFILSDNNTFFSVSKTPYKYLIFCSGKTVKIKK